MDNLQLEKAKAIMSEVSRILGTKEVYLVGGATRDIVMDQPVKDWDFTTSMLPEEMVEKVKAAGRRVYTIGEKFGTIGFKVKAPVKVINVTVGSEQEGKITYETEPVHYGFEYVEVTTFRSEVYTSKSRKPEVEFVTSLDEDLARRDFTMNAMVLRGDGSIYDPYGGRLDIYAKQIKTVGMPKDRIQEDPLRMLRAARFAARYGFKIDPNFIGKARQLADRIFDVSVERWGQELDKLLLSDNSYNGLYQLSEMGLLQRILPELLIDKYGVVEGKKDVDLEWKYLLNNIALPKSMKNQERTKKYIMVGICARLKFSNDRTNFILDKHKKKE